jgi:hypothetical protein
MNFPRLTNLKKFLARARSLFYTTVLIRKFGKSRLGKAFGKWFVDTLTFNILIQRHFAIAEIRYMLDYYYDPRMDDIRPILRRELFYPLRTLLGLAGQDEEFIIESTRDIDPEGLIPDLLDWRFCHLDPVGMFDLRSAYYECMIDDSIRPTRRYPAHITQQCEEFLKKRAELHPNPWIV